MVLRNLPQLFEITPASDRGTGGRLTQAGVDGTDVIAEKVAVSQPIARGCRGLGAYPPSVGSPPATRR